MWGSDLNGSSSNYRELQNLVETVKEEVEQGNLARTEVFLFTDNEVAERAFFKGTSKSEQLFNLVLRLQKATLRGGLQLHVVHVAGTRMIDEGTDALS